MAKLQSDLDVLRAKNAHLEGRMLAAEAQVQVIARQRDAASIRAAQLQAQLLAFVDAVALIATGAHAQLRETKA